MAQIIKRGEQKYLIRVYLGTDTAGQRTYYSKMVRCSYSDACKHARKLETRRDLGELLTSSNSTVGHFLDEWLKIVKPQLSIRTADSYASLIKHHIKPVLGAKKLSSLGALEIEMLYRSLEGKKSRRTIQYIHAVISAALRYAVRWKMIPHSPASDTDPKLRRRSARQITIKPLTEPELKLFLKHARRDPYYRVFLIAATTGLRPGEYLALRWRDVNLVNNTITVERALVRENKKYVFAPPKTPKSRRTIPIPSVALEALKIQKKDQNKQRIKTKGYKNLGLVFAGAKGEPLDESNLRRRHFHKILKAAKLEQRRLYDLRHTWVTLALAAGGNPKTISESAGHSSVAFTLDVYSHVIPSMERGLSETVERLFSAAVSG